MCGYRTVPQKAVEIETFIDIEGQPLAWLRLAHTGQRCHGKDAGGREHE